MVDERFRGCNRINAVIRVLRDNGGPMRTSEISQELEQGGVNWPRQTISTPLARAMARGAVERLKPGVFRAAQ